MKKKIIIIAAVILGAIILFSLFTGNKSDKDNVNPNDILDTQVNNEQSSSENVDANDVPNNQEQEEQSDDSLLTKKVTMNINEFENLLNQQDFKFISTKYIVQDDTYKSLYPDVLQAIVENNTEYDIKNAVVAFVAWDKNNLPVKIIGDMDFSDGTYVKRVNYNDINMTPNSTFGNNSGYEINYSCGIASFKAIVVSYESFTGETWENPYFDEWCKMYEGVKYSDSLTVDVAVE